ncbi:prepilin peptidase [Vibrio cincinnatiensis]|uniref:prepilin peptidase n=1 Tax=Vibrio cincinnatiensis TaxID=675 RepID=UPI001EE10974|nr:prepilin peptidase [Vibrio cincinnatiensis]MCG3759806.1 prepilin peptidase [Vibrio cincinnatiensis]MCG3763021.1 prepilin peptidase [Vibrio cincinnatiensis]
MTLLPWLASGCFLILSGYCVRILYSDYHYRRIANQDIIYLGIISFIVSLISTNYWGMVTAILFLLLGLVLFIFNLWGAGDVKLLAVLSLAIRPEFVFLNFFSIVLLGGLIAVGLVITAWITKEREIVTSGVPYSFAIIPPAWLAIMLTLIPYF